MASFDQLVATIDGCVEVLNRGRVDRHTEMEAITDLDDAVSKIGGVGKDAAVDPLAQLLDEVYHAICVTPVGPLGAASGIGRLWSTVKVILCALGDTGSSQAVEPILKVLQGKEGRHFESACLSALKQLASGFDDYEFTRLVSTAKYSGYAGAQQFVTELQRVNRTGR